MSKAREPEELAELVEPAKFRARFLEAFGGPPRAPVVVGVGTRHASACTAIDASGRTSAHAASLRLLPGCLTKLVTSVLIAECAAAGEIDLDDDVGAMLEQSLGARVLLRQALEHTHGLDGSRFERLPRTPRARIDAAGLCAALRRTRVLARPGRLYSYGDVGCWLAAAVLERVRGQSFARLARDALDSRRRRGVRFDTRRRRSPDSARICPSTGGAFCVGIGALVEFLAGAALEACGPALVGAASGRRPMTSMPGFSMLERGVCLGWKHFGGAWFGHNSTWAGSEALTRVHARSGIALVVAANEPSALVVAARLFAGWLPEFSALRAPQPLGERELEALDAARFEGTYLRAAEALTISAGAAGAHGLVLERRTRARPRGRRFESRRVQLQPAENDLFMTRPTCPAVPFVQYIGERAAGFEHVWDGRRIWRRHER